jgi:hypothetical protein
MPDVGLFSAAEPLSKDMKVVLKYTVEVNGLEVYSESYDAEKLAEEVANDEAEVARVWIRRIKCVIGCRNRRGFSACVTRCLTDGKVCDCGHEQPESVEKKG